MLCGQKSQWRMECPPRTSNSGQELGNLAPAVVVSPTISVNDEDLHMNSMELDPDLPANTKSLEEEVMAKVLATSSAATR